MGVLFGFLCLLWGGDVGFLTIGVWGFFHFDPLESFGFDDCAGVGVDFA